MNIQKMYKKNFHNLLIEKFYNLNYSTLNYKNLEIGNAIDIYLKELHNDNYKIKKITGTIIAKQKKNFNQSFTIRRFVEGIGLDQIFIYNSPHIIQINKILSYKIKRNKLYFLKKSLAKSIKLKKKISQTKNKTMY